MAAAANLAGLNREAGCLAARPASSGREAASQAAIWVPASGRSEERRVGKEC